MGLKLPEMTRGDGRAGLGLALIVIARWPLILLFTQKL